MYVRAPWDAKAIEFLVRTVVASIMALAIVGAVIYQSIRSRPISPDLLSWGGIVIGVYIGGHLTANGKLVGRGEVSDELRQQVDRVAQSHEPPTP